MIEPGEQDLLAATQGLSRRVRPEFVNYAKRAKRVDVRKLKENIWKGLDIVVPKGEDQKEDEDAMVCASRSFVCCGADVLRKDLDDRPATDPAEPREMTSVISGLQKTYPKDKLEEISTSFCFICLLHLANERGLKIQSEDALQEEEERKVGRIWDLKVCTAPLSDYDGLTRLEQVYRDPDA